MCRDAESVSYCGVCFELAFAEKIARMKRGGPCLIKRCDGRLLLLPPREREATVTAYKLGGWLSTEALPWIRAYGVLSVKYVPPGKRRK